MSNRSEMEILYDNYLESDDIVIEIDDRQFYKIISKTKIPGKDGVVLICVPNHMFKGKQYKILDEKGVVFEMSAPAHFRFEGTIPKWYVETFSLVMPAGIGDYITLIEE